MLKNKVLWVRAVLVFVAAHGMQAVSGEGSLELSTGEHLDWGYLNPARGDKGPRAADLWGDRTRDTASGILLQFPEGFSSPPHIHNITYRGVVIEGELHNDDPAAEPMWLPAGSFWTQPAGETHITAAAGKRNIAYIEIEKGPYLVQAPEASYSGTERPVNVHPSNQVWLGSSELPWLEGSAASLSYLWGTPGSDELYGVMLRLPAGFAGTLYSEGERLRAVLVQGQLIHRQQDSDIEMSPGAYFTSSGAYRHQLQNPGDAESVLYLRLQGQLGLESGEQFRSDSDDRRLRQ